MGESVGSSPGGAVERWILWAVGLGWAVGERLAAAWAGLWLLWASLLRLLSLALAKVLPHQHFRLDALPKHIGVLVTEEGGSSSRVCCDVSVWACAYGAASVVLYDPLGDGPDSLPRLAALLQRHTHNPFASTLRLLLTARGHKDRLVLLPGKEDGAAVPVDRSGPLRVAVLGAGDGRGSVVRAARRVLAREAPPSLHAISEEHSKEGLEETDLLLKVGGLDSLCGYPPWLLRVTELVSLGSPSSVSEEAFLTAVHAFSQRQRRFGSSSSFDFDFRRFGRRHVALLVAYLGWDYQGLVCQETTEETIEEQLLRALEKTKLLEDRTAAAISRCGRTDKGVSAFHQVMALKLRSNLRCGLGVEAAEAEGDFETAESSEAKEELEYAGLANRCLPNGIRVLAWAPVPEAFSARHSCTRRVYKYLLPRGDLDLQAMSSAALALEGEHDFRHFCKQERSEPRKPTVRSIYEARLGEVGGTGLGGESASGDPYSLVELTIVGSGFLWHQIRCVVAVLLAVGEGREAPSVVPQMLDVEAHPTKPVYALASDLPLCLFHAEYAGAEPEWVWSPEAIRHTIRHLQEQWLQAQTRATMIRSMLGGLGGLGCPVEAPADLHKSLHPGPLPSRHRPFFPQSNK